MTQQGAVEGGGVGVLLLAGYLVRHLSSVSVRRSLRSSVPVSGCQDESPEARLWKLSHIRRTCVFVYSLVGMREASVAGSVGVALLLRSLCDLKMVHLTAAVENALVSRNPLAFRTALRNFLGFMVPISALNALLNYSINELALCLRERLSKRLLAKYTSNDAFYRVGLALHGRGGEGRYEFDQVLTHDLEEFTEALAGMFSHTLKPIVDVVIFAERLWSTFGKEAPLTLGAYMIFSGMVLNYMRSAAGQYASGEQELEGVFRHAVARLHEHAEQIASFGGGGREQSAIFTRLDVLLAYVRSFAQFRGSMSVIDNVAGKYFLTSLGWVLLSRPFLDKSSSASMMKNKTDSEAYWEYQTISKMMINLSSAIGALLLSGRDFVRCIGITERLCDFEELLDSLALDTTRSENQESSPTDAGGGNSDAALRLVDVPLVTPHGQELVSSVSLTLKRGTCLLITGPNGSGKSSLMRVLAGLWTPTSGFVYRAREAEMLQESFYNSSDAMKNCAADSLNPGMAYLPQKPYMPIGTLRDQLLYPGSCPKWKDKETQLQFDGTLFKLLQIVHLEYLLERDGGWDALADWAAVLSGGEKQRISIARLYYHRPTFALFDESTSAVHEEVEDDIYQRIKELGITLITVSHRRSLRKHHDIELRFDGRGHYDIFPI